jgi:hypothetical protein
MAHRAPRIIDAPYVIYALHIVDLYATYRIPWCAPQRAMHHALLRTVHRVHLRTAYRVTCALCSCATTHHTSWTFTRCTLQIFYTPYVVHPFHISHVPGDHRSVRHVLTSLSTYKPSPAMRGWDPMDAFIVPTVSDSDDARITGTLVRIPNVSPSFICSCGCYLSE